MRKTPRISLRTPGAGWGQPLGPLELNALGDWEDRSSLPDPAAMPVHYSGGKKATSMRVKHLVYQLGASLREHQSWDVITPSELEEAKAFVMPTVDRLVSQDMDTEWQGKLPAEQVQRAFKFSQATRESARAARASAAAAAASQMPAAIKGKLLTKFMRNGTPLCADFQTDSCSRNPCPEQHLCAIVLQSGRACGGSHSAQTCYARRALTEERAAAKGLLPLAQEPAVPTEAPAEPAESQKTSQWLHQRKSRLHQCLHHHRQARSSRASHQLQPKGGSDPPSKWLLQHQPRRSRRVPQSRRLPPQQPSHHLHRHQPQKKPGLRCHQFQPALQQPPKTSNGTGLQQCEASQPKHPRCCCPLRPEESYGWEASLYPCFSTTLPTGHLALG